LFENLEQVFYEGFLILYLPTDWIVERLSIYVFPIGGIAIPVRCGEFDCRSLRSALRSVVLIFGVIKVDGFSKVFFSFTSKVFKLSSKRVDYNTVRD
jgi:hypothetical protein